MLLCSAFRGKGKMKMLRNKNYEITKIGDEYMAVPIGEEAISFHGVVTLSEPSAFLLNQLTEPRSKAELFDLLLEEYEVDSDLAKTELNEIIKTFIELKLVLDE